MAARHIWAVQAGRQKALVTPTTVARCLLPVAGHPCLAVLEEELNGRPFCQPLSISHAAELGHGLSAWHSIKHVPAFMRCFYQHRSYASLLKLVLRRRRTLYPETPLKDRVLIEAIDWLTDTEFMGDISISHGDLHKGNLLDLGHGNLAWLDMDAVCLRPLRRDLATCQLGTLRKSPQTVDIFEEVYFRDRPAERSAWIQHRRRWFVLHSLLKSAKCLSGELPLPGGRENAEEIWQRRYEMHIAYARAAYDIRDCGQGTGELVREIVEAAECYRCRTTLRIASVQGIE